MSRSGAFSSEADTGSREENATKQKLGAKFRFNLIGVFAGLVLALGLAGAASAQERRPTAVLLDGLGVYVTTSYVGVSALAEPLRRQGYRALIDNHLALNVAEERPAILIGHSMGGTMALRLAAREVAAGRPAPLVITIDAAFGSPPCPVPRCINYHSPGFPQIEGAENIDAWKAGAFMVPHAMLATNPAVQKLVLDRAAALIAEQRAPVVMRFAPVPEPRPR